MAVIILTFYFNTVCINDMPLYYISLEMAIYPPKPTGQSIYMDDIRFYINCENVLVRMDNCVIYISYVNNWKYFDDIIVRAYSPVTTVQKQWCVY